MSVIAAHAGVTKGAMYFHFPTKHALAEAVIAERNTSWTAMVAEATARGLDPVRTIIAFTHAAALCMSRDPRVRGGNRLLNDPLPRVSPRSPLNSSTPPKPRCWPAHQRCARRTTAPLYHRERPYSPGPRHCRHAQGSPPKRGARSSRAPGPAGPGCLDGHAMGWGRDSARLQLAAAITPTALDPHNHTRRTHPGARHSPYVTAAVRDRPPRLDRRLPALQHSIHPHLSHPRHPARRLRVRTSRPRNSRRALGHSADRYHPAW